MNQRQKEQREMYSKMVDRASPKSEKTFSILRAYLVGGLICVFGQALTDLGRNYFKLSDEYAAAFCAIVLVFIGATLTGIGVYDKIGRFAGAGSIVPITGFANSIVAPAMEFRREGLVTGVGAKMFAIAGPVLVYGTIASIITGLIYYFFVGGAV